MRSYWAIGLIVLSAVDLTTRQSPILEPSRSPAEFFCQLALPSTEPTAAEVTFVCSVLFDICRIPFFRRVGVMLMFTSFLSFDTSGLLLGPLLLRLAGGIGGLRLDMVLNSRCCER